MRLDRAIQALAAVAFGLGFLAFGIAGFARMDSSEKRVEAKLDSIRAGQVQPDALIVLKKYVNPGKSGLPHIVFSSVRQAKVDLSATRDYFNSVRPGETVPGYYFSDGYFIPENCMPDTGGGKWFFLGLGILLGGGTLALAIAAAKRLNK